ncbi:MAG: GatB/YqeY domain-containing protein [Bacteroidota bacterium]
MTLTDQINADIKSAMLAREKDKLEALRAIKSAILLLNTQEGATGEINPEEEIKLLQRLVKQRREAASIYEGQNRPDLASVELAQALVIEKYLPEQMSVEEITAILKAVVAETGATSIRDMGKVMGLASTRLAGKADNKIVAGLIKEMLGI